MSKFNNNPRKNKFIEQFPETSLENCDIESRFKFNFSYFDETQEHGSAFNDLEPGTLVQIMEKIKAYTRHDLNYWRNQRCGAHGLKIFADYGPFPPKSNFTHPKSVPHDISWCRFRMENRSRLIGFTVPASYTGKQKKDCLPYDTNTVYLVFIDLEHNFYLSEKK